MTVCLSNYNAVRELNRAQIGSNFQGYFDPRIIFGDDVGLPVPPEGEGDSERWADLRSAATASVFGSDEFRADPEFERDCELPTSAEEAVAFAERHGFDLTIEGAPARDWFLFSWMIAACMRGLTALDRNAIEEGFARGMLEKLGLTSAGESRSPDDEWLAQNDRTKPVLPHHQRYRSRW